MTTLRNRHIAYHLGVSAAQLETLTAQVDPVLTSPQIAAALGAIDYRQLAYWLANAPSEAALSEPVAPTTQHVSG